MKNDYEMYQSVLSRRDKYRRKKEKHIRMIKRTAALTLGTAAVLGIGIFTRAMKPPKKPTPNQSGIITETEAEHYCSEDDSNRNDDCHNDCDAPFCSKDFYNNTYDNSCGSHNNCSRRHD